jgi:hypothetical protein
MALTKAECQKLAKQLCERIGPDWTPRVHENLGWHYNAECKASFNETHAVYEYGPDNFWADLRIACHQYEAHGTTPWAAIHNALEKAQVVADDLANVRRQISSEKAK